MKGSEIKRGMKLRALRGKREGEAGVAKKIGTGQVDVEFLDGTIRYYGYDDVEPADALIIRVRDQIVNETIDRTARQILHDHYLEDKLASLQALQDFLHAEGCIE